MSPQDTLVYLHFIYPQTKTHLFQNVTLKKKIHPPSQTHVLLQVALFKKIRVQSIFSQWKKVVVDLSNNNRVVCD